MERQTLQERYRIEVTGRLDPARSAWLDSLDLRVEARTGGPVTVLSGPVADQAALMGLLRRLHNLGLTLLLVQRLDSVPPPDGGNQP
jgi:hypothetical protein